MAGLAVRSGPVRAAIIRPLRATHTIQGIRIAILDKFSRLGLPIQISEFGMDTDDAQLQSDYRRDFMTAAFSEPSVIGVVQWGFWEKAHWLPRAVL